MAKRGNHLLISSILLAFLLYTQGSSFSLQPVSNASREHQENKSEKEGIEINPAIISVKIQSKKPKSRVTNSAYLVCKSKPAAFTFKFIPVKPALIILYRTLII